jgi:uncharacterized protein YejL (UPF0352 family)
MTLLQMQELAVKECFSSGLYTQSNLVRDIGMSDLKYPLTVIGAIFASLLLWNFAMNQAKPIAKEHVAEAYADSVQASVDKKFADPELSQAAHDATKSAVKDIMDGKSLDDATAGAQAAARAEVEEYVRESELDQWNSETSSEGGY